MNSYREYAQRILLGETLEDKNLDIPFEWNSWNEFELPKLPGRNARLAFSDKHFKFPKSSRLNENDQKAMALHSFANHELLAIEMMAAAILIYPHTSDEDIRFKKGILTTLKDEQKHLNLYIKRLNELGYEFGDFPLNDFFWRQMEKLKTAPQYTAMMALTFEAANLDFAQHYAKVFRSLGDTKTSEILDIVLADEITHVAFGSHWMKRWRADNKLWDYYLSCMPGPITPSRSKGIYFDPTLHAKAMNDEEFISSLIGFDDNFNITKRASNP
jgi:uncharacterized ferritin-like protein (DUF455 family)